jgi:hypothetical protein
VFPLIAGVTLPSDNKLVFHCNINTSPSRDETIQVTIPVYTEMSQETPCVAILNNNNKKSVFFFCKIREQEGRTGPAWEGWYQWEG